ncbi:peroxygenase 1-like [Aristolochia californica]|uniref:peroxygenase 1-like n=1 Tax=Aristolochia californica TaxID=171875 RepID=UPI0035DEAC3C
MVVGLPVFKKKMAKSKGTESKDVNLQKKTSMAQEEEEKGLEDRHITLPKLLGVDVENFQRRWKRKNKSKSAVIYPWETYKEMMALGFGSVVSLVVAFWLHLLLSYWTLPGWIPSLLFPIYMQEIDKSENGSDNEAVNFVGRIVTSYVEAIFKKYESSI